MHINNKNKHLQNKKKILIYIDWFVPAFKAGGPVRSVENIVNRFADKFDFLIITSDRDLGDLKAFENIETNKIIERNGFKITYLSPEKQNYNYLKNLIKTREFDTVYFNSLFSVKFTLLPLFLTKKIKKNSKIILAPRGMLGKGSLEIKSFKKNLFLKLAKLVGLFKNITWHATNSVEIENIKTYFSSKANIVLASNLPDKTKDFYKREFFDTLKLVCISRISKIKNIRFAIEILTKVKTEKSIVFDIFGPEEDKNYLEKCIEETQNLPENIQVNFKGIVAHDKIQETLKNYNFLLFPTQHENFGHTIFESFSSGLPVIISKNTPWQNLEEKNIGFDIDLSEKETFVKTIENICKFSLEKYNEMSFETFNFAVKFSSDEQIIKQTQKLFEDE